MASFCDTLRSVLTLMPIAIGKAIRFLACLDYPKNLLDHSLSLILFSYLSGKAFQNRQI